MVKKKVSKKKVKKVKEPAFTTEQLNNLLEELLYLREKVTQQEMSIHFTCSCGRDWLISRQ